VTVEWITPAEALAAIRAASWTKYDHEAATCGHPGCTDHPAETQRIHTRSRRGFGADWDLAEAEAYVQSAMRCGWGEDLLFGHELGVVGRDDRLIFFEVKRPAARASHQTPHTEETPTP